MNDDLRQKYRRLSEGFLNPNAIPTKKEVPLLPGQQVQGGAYDSLSLTPEQEEAVRQIREQYAAQQEPMMSPEERLEIERSRKALEMLKAGQKPQMPVPRDPSELEDEPYDPRIK